MTDRKTYSLRNDHRALDAGDLFHDMAICATVDDALLLQSIDVNIDAGPHRICPSITPDFQRLTGWRIEAGFGAELRRRLGGVHGCTHLVATMIGDFATADREIARLIELSRGLNVPLFETRGRVLKGRLLVAHGEFAQGLTVLRDAFETYDRTGWRPRYAEFKGALALALAGTAQRGSRRSRRRDDGHR